jgi:hypothetical protein
VLLLLLRECWQCCCCCCGSAGSAAAAARVLGMLVLVLVLVLVLALALALVHRPHAHCDGSIDANDGKNRSRCTDGQESHCILISVP